MTTELRFRQYIALSALLLIVAVVLRVYGLDDLGFYGDEDTTSLPSRYLAQNGSPEFPSGMQYYRALPQTYANALFAQAFGIDNEASYRASSVVAGILSIITVLVLLPRLTCTSVALTAAAILAVSEWHVLISREARMYAPLVLGQLLFILGFAKLCTHRSASAWIAIVAGACLLVTMHRLSVFVATFPLLFLIAQAKPNPTQRETHIPALSYLTAWIVSIGLVVTTIGYDLVYVDPGYTKFFGRFGAATASGAIASEAPVLVLIAAAADDIYTIFFAALAATFSVFTTRRRYEFDGNGAHKILALRLTLGGTILFTAIGQLFGAALLGVMNFVLSRQTLTEYVKAHYVPLAIVSVVGIGHAVYSIGTEGPTGLRNLATAPYPTVLSLNSQTALLACFGATVAFLALTRRARSSPAIVTASVLAILTTVFLMGLIEEWTALRYLVVALPYFAIVAAYAIVELFRLALGRFAKSEVYVSTASILATIMLPAGGLGIGSAVSAAHLDYGNSVDSFLFSGYPDHQSTGHWLKSVRQENDVVIAEDAIAQSWYAGSIDYWLRSPTIDAQFHVIDSSGNRRDIYAFSKIASVEDLATLESYCIGRVFLVTSAEVILGRQFYQDNDQIAWVKRIEDTIAPVVLGRDNLSGVYCVNCRTLLTQCPTLSRPSLP